MDKLRRSIRQSFRRKNSKDFLEDANKPHQWQKDEAAVRSGTCSFSVKYLGCVEVFESRGMQVCEEALKVLRNSRRKTVRGFLYVSGDGLRVVDADNKGLIVDQTIEKVSFCAPDRNNDKGFAYICRDGTTRRWMCHGFSASKDSGERLSHAVGCAFAVCLEHKQKRDREAASQVMAPTTTDEKSTPKKVTTATVEHSNSYVAPTTGSGFSATNPSLQASFRRASLAERKQDPQNVIPAEKVPIKQTSHPNAVARPAPNRALFERQGSLRMPGSSSSMVISDAPSTDPTFQRFQSLRLGPTSACDFVQTQKFTKLNGNTPTVDAIWEGEEDSLNDTMAMPSSSSSQHDSIIQKNMTNLNGKVSSIERQKILPSYSQHCSSNISTGISGENISSQAKSKGEEWLHIAASQAKLLKQLRETPPLAVATAGSAAAYGSSPVPATTGGSGGALPPPSSSSYSTNGNYYSTPPLGAPSSSAYINDGQATSASSNGGADSPASSSTFSPVKNNANYQTTTMNINKQSSASDHLNNWRASSSFDAASTATTTMNFGFSNSSSSSSTTNFDDKWNSLTNAPSKIHNNNSSASNLQQITSTNPFKQESSAV